MYNFRLNEFSDKQLDTLAEWADEKLILMQISHMNAELLTDDQEMTDIINKIEGGNPYLDYMVYDVHDGIEVNWSDLMEAWEKGERPKDLQMF